MILVDRWYRVTGNDYHLAKSGKIIYLTSFVMIAEINFMDPPLIWTDE